VNPVNRELVSNRALCDRSRPNLHCENAFAASSSIIANRACLRTFTSVTLPVFGSIIVGKYRRRGSATIYGKDIRAPVHKGIRLSDHSANHSKLDKVKTSASENRRDRILNRGGIYDLIRTRWSLEVDSKEDA
jgi:hypothetical protein